jgi:ketosteroid isomerase-like protein
VTFEELTRAGYDAWSRRDWEGFAAVLRPDVVWVTSGVLLGLDDEYVGREAVVAFLREFSETWEEISAVPLELRTVEDGTVCDVHFRARGRGGVDVDRMFGHHLTFEDGRLRKLVTYEDFDQALAAAGLS